MSEVLWWRKESWYEAKSIPILDFFVSPRQVFFVIGFGFLGLILSIFIPVYYVKIAVVFIFLLVGAVLSALPSKIVPFELALLYHYRKAVPAPKSPKITKEQPVPEVSAGMNVPFAVTGELKVSKPTDVTLFVDDVEIAKATVTPENPKYKLYYYPTENERGAHILTVKAEGETITEVKVNVA